MRTTHIEIFGASVRGPAHAAEGAANHDAWRQGSVGSMRVVALSDGLGSRPHARVGASEACDAVMDAVRQWRRHSQAPVDVLLGLVHLLWRARVAPRAPEDCATTCLFAALNPDGSGVAAQIGDGLILLRQRLTLTRLGGRSEEQFANETSGLGITTRLSAWSYAQLEPAARTVVLCTDGVADDLLPERFSDFVDWLITDIRVETPTRRRQVLQRALLEWPTPKHLDDKTIAVIHMAEEGV